MPTQHQLYSMTSAHVIRLENECDTLRYTLNRIRDLLTLPYLECQTCNPLDLDHCHNAILQVMQAIEDSGL